MNPIGQKFISDTLPQKNDQRRSLLEKKRIRKTEADEDENNRVDPVEREVKVMLDIKNVQK